MNFFSFKLNAINNEELRIHYFEEFLNERYLLHSSQSKNKKENAGTQDTLTIQEVKSQFSRP